jgi:hypothetical protein
MLAGHGTFAVAAEGQDEQSARADARDRSCDGRAGTGCRGVRPEQRLLGPDAGRLAEVREALDRVLAGQRPGPRDVPRLPEVIGPDVHGSRPRASHVGHRRTVSVGT